MNAKRVRERWFGLLLWSFPTEFRSDNGAELLGFIEERTSWSAAVTIRESLALLKAGIVVSYRMTVNLPSTTHFGRGAAAWLGLLLGIGPVMRVAELRAPYGPETSGINAGLAVVGVVTAIAVLPRSRIAGLSIVGLSLVAAARSTARGSWTATEAFSYEAAWLLPAIVAIALADSRLKRTTYWPTLISAIAIGSTVTLTAVTDHAYGGSYGYALQSMVFDPRVSVAGLAVLGFSALSSPRLLTRFGLPMLQILTFAIAGKQFGIAIFVGCCLSTIALNARRQDRMLHQSPVSD